MVINLSRPFRACRVDCIHPRALPWAEAKSPLALVLTASWPAIFERNGRHRRKTHPRSKKMWVKTSLLALIYFSARVNDPSHFSITGLSLSATQCEMYMSHR